jgi:hypothetical protein
MESTGAYMREKQGYWGGGELESHLRNFKAHFTITFFNYVPEYTYIVSKNIFEYKVNFRKLHAFAYGIM